MLTRRLTCVDLALSTLDIRGDSTLKNNGSAPAGDGGEREFCAPVLAETAQTQEEEK